MSGSIADCPPSTPATRSATAALLWRILGPLCRYALAAFFLVAAVGKITDLPSFRDYLAVHVGLGPAAEAPGKHGAEGRH